MKTAMQELIELIENGETELYLIENHKQIWLEREKEHIMDFFLKGYSIGESDLNPKVEFEKYYNQTYEQNLQEQINILAK